MIYNTITNNDEKVVIKAIIYRETLVGGKSYNVFMNGFSSYREEMLCRLFRYNYREQNMNFVHF